MTCAEKAETWEMCASDSDVSAHSARMPRIPTRNTEFFTDLSDHRHLVCCSPGIYVDVGSSHPYHLSNTAPGPEKPRKLRLHVSFFPHLPTRRFKQYIQRPYFRPSVLPSVLPSCALASLAYRKLHSQLLSLARLSGPHWTRNSITRCRKNAR